MAHHPTSAPGSKSSAASVRCLSTPHQAADGEALAKTLGALAAGVFSGAAMHTPVEVTEAALAEAKEVKADCVVALGGGSTTGLGKAIAWRTDLPQIVIPTTYAGSEVTPILGQTEASVKTTLRDPKILPEVVIYDPELTVGLPVAMSVTSGLNAMAHAAEALYAQDRNPVSTLMATEGLRALRAALPTLVKEPRNLEARGDALYGAWLCGTVLGPWHVAAPQDLPHAGRFQRHAHAGPCGDAPAHDRLQRRRRARIAEAGRRPLWQRGWRPA